MSDHHELLGLSPDAPPEEVENRIRSELLLWQRRTNSPELAVRQQAEQRVERLLQVRAELLGGRPHPGPPSPPATPPGTADVSRTPSDPAPRPSPSAPPPMPGTLKALRVLFFLFGGLSLLVFAFVLLALFASGTMDDVQREAGVAAGLLVVGLLLLCVLVSVAYLVFAVKMAGAGRTYMKVLAGFLILGLVLGVVNLLVPQIESSGASTLPVSVLLIVLALSGSSRRYFAANDAART